MGLLLAPYNDSMRLGQGYNSFLQSPCIYNAVSISEQGARIASSNSETSQTVSYTSHAITKISDITRSMGVSTGSSIKNGSIALSGNASSIDELKFVESDLNIVLSVKVVNQTTDTVDKDNMKFNKSAAESIPPGDHKRFHEVFGDCYISGFVEGGDLHGIISIKVLDSSRKEEIKSKIMGQLNNSNQPEFTFEPTGYESALVNHSSSSETTIVVNWSGGGEVKAESEEWSLDSLYRVAAAFPAKVALCPQRTRAILTPYGNNPEFTEWAIERGVTPYDYSSIKSYASDLLDTYVGYKNNIRRIQSVLANPKVYILGPARDPISISVKDLVSARKQIKTEMAKIMDEVDSINERPDQFVDTIENSFIKAPELWADKLPVRADLPSGISTELRQFALLDSDITRLESESDKNADIPDILEQPYDLGVEPPNLGATSLSEIEQKALMDDLNRRVLAHYRFDATPVAIPTTASGTVIEQNELRDKIRMNAVFSAKFKFPSAARISISSKQGVPVLVFTFVFGEEPISSTAYATGPNAIDLKLDAEDRINRIRIGRKVVDGKEVVSYVKIRTSSNQEKIVGETPSLQKNISDFAPPAGCSGLAFWISTSTHKDTGAVGRLLLAWK